MFYHDHAYGITRLNVYAGEAAGYLLTDQLEKDMINGTDLSGINPTGAKVLPDTGIPLVIQDKSFVDETTINAQDPTWNWGTTPGTANTGDLWYPHVYMTNQNPADIGGMNAFGRWHYGPWFWPPTTGITYPPILNPYYDPVNAPWENQYMPATPNPSMAMEAFMDTPLVNGKAYPYLEVEPRTYRFRILNAADDRFFNLQLYVADPAVTTADSRTNTEVKMVPAVPTEGFPAEWPTDGREGGVPDPTTKGPSFIQIGTEGGFLPAPAVLPNLPVGWNFDQTNFDFGNVNQGTLTLGTAERADVIVDFSAYAGKTLILYNDAPAPFPAIDARYDYYTGHPDLTGTGGTPTTQPGYGPNTRTIMQIKVAAAPTVTPFARGGDRTLWYKNRVDTTWNSWQSLGGQIDLLAATSSGNNVYAFARGGDGALWYRNGAGATWNSWQSWEDRLTFLLQHHPAVVSMSLDVVWMVPYGIGNGMELHGVVGRAWEDRLTFLRLTSSGNSVYVFGRGLDGSLWHRKWDGTAWGSWLSLGGQIDLLAATSSGNSVDVFATWFGWFPMA